jgi:hypothetical protein
MYAAGGSESIFQAAFGADTASLLATMESCLLKGRE